MELPDEYTSFWSAPVKPDYICRIRIPDGVDCTLTNAAVCCDEFGPEDGRILLSAKVNGGEEIAIVPFILQKFESTMLDISFSEGDLVEFFVHGAECPVHIAGIMTGYSLDVEQVPINPPALVTNQIEAE